MGTIEPATSRRVLALALPATLANVTTPLLGLVGAMAIGRMGDAALLGAVALGAVVFDVIFWSFGSLRMATAGLTAQASGANDRRDIDLTLARALVAAVMIGLVLVLAQIPILAGVLALTDASPAVATGLATYFHLRIFAAPFTLSNYVILGSVTGRGRTDLGLALQVTINLVNIGLTLLFVVVLEWGIVGAAISALIAEAGGTMAGLALVRMLGSRPFAVPVSALRDQAALARTIRVNGDILIRTLALVAAISLFTALGVRSGDVTLAANAVLWNLFLIGGFFLDGFATAAEVLCGRAVGARDESAFRSAARLGLLWCLGFGIVVSGLFLAGGPHFIDAVSTNAEVRADARAELTIAALTPLAAALPFAFDGIFIGATWTRPMRDLMLAAVVVYAATLVAFEAAGWANRGLWLAFLGFLAARGLGQLAAYPSLTRRTFARSDSGTEMK